MNRHTKIAIFIAPILTIAGYILSDTYVENQASQQRIFKLTPESTCDVLASQCILTSGELKINVFDENGSTYINSTFPLDAATLFLIDRHEQATAYPLEMEKSAHYWNKKTPLRTKMSKKDSKQKIRIIAQIKGGQYISEFYTMKL